MATFDEPEETGAYGRKERGWQRDQAGRDYRLTTGGAVREYRRREDRDQALDDSYRLSPAVLAFLGERPPSIAGAVMGNAVSLAELFWEETGSWTGRPDERFDRWCAHHLGRRLEPAPRMVMLYEIRRRTSLDDGGRVGPPAGAFRDFAEERRYASAAERVPLGLGSFDRCTWIAREAGAKLGPGPQPFPEPPDVETEANRQRAAVSADGPWEDGR
jgi:hypothetical protein